MISRRLLLVVGTVLVLSHGSLQAQLRQNRLTLERSKSSSSSKSSGGIFKFMGGGKSSSQSAKKQRKLAAEREKQRERERLAELNSRSAPGFRFWGEEDGSRSAPWLYDRNPAPIFAAQAQPDLEKEASTLTAGDETVWQSSMSYRQYRESPYAVATDSFRTRLYEVSGRSRSGAQPKSSLPAGPPFATPIAGRPGFVDLSFDERGLPPVDVRGLAPGIEVEIPDPLEPGKAIRFRIPEQSP